MLFFGKFLEFFILRIDGLWFFVLIVNLKFMFWVFIKEVILSVIVLVLGDVFLLKFIKKMIVICYIVFKKSIDVFLNNNCIKNDLG